jgi:hypothetical protein
VDAHGRLRWVCVDFAGHGAARREASRVIFVV